MEIGGRKQELKSKISIDWGLKDNKKVIKVRSIVCTKIPRIMN